MNLKLVESTKNSVIKKIVAFLLILVLTMFDFMLLGTEIVSYAANAIETATNNKNVTFDSYFKDENGVIVTEKEAKINDQNIKLYAQVSVKNDGYFNGTISIENGNFNLKNEILSSSINKIEGNTITLNQINGGEIVELEVEIEPIKNETINLGLLSMSSTISIDGIYRNSQEKDLSISAKRDVKLLLANPYNENEGLDLATSIITNKLYEINGKSERIVQVLVESGLQNNEYPVKENSIEMSVPNGVENVEVISRGTLSSNGKSESSFNTNNWEYSAEEQKVKVLIKNEEENNTIKWLKNGKDRIVVTFIIDPKTNVTNSSIMTTSKITMYDTKSTVKEATSIITVSEEKDGIITSDIKLKEESMFKGKIYSGEEREYETTANIYVNNAETGKNVLVELLPATYETAEGRLPANIQYKNTVISKAEVIKVLGEQGTLRILGIDGTIIKEINKDSQTDENGNILVEYPEGVTAIKVETTTAVSTGTINLNNTKIIKQDSNNRQTKSSYISIVEKVSEEEAKISLKETSTVAKVQSNKTSLSTLTENNGVEITATLKTNSEENELYKNPNIKISLPSQVENITLNSVKLLYDDELTITSTNVINENGSKVLDITLEGEQTKHNNGNVEGATIIINTNLDLNRKATNSDETLKMTYTNQNTGESLETSQPIQIVSPRGMVTINSIEDYGMSVIGEEETKTSKLELSSVAKQSEVDIEVINNNEETVKNVKVMGDFPTKNETNSIDTSVSALEVSGVEATVYYTENANASDNIEDRANGWSTEITNNASVKKYLIQVDNMEQSQGLSASYKLNIPENLQYNEEAYEGYKVIYSDANTTNEVAATTLGLSTGKGPELKTTIKAKTGNSELSNGAEIAQGEVVRYEISIQNTGTEPATNVNVTGIVPEGTIYVEPKEDYIYEDGYYNEFADKKDVTFNIESIPAGETVTKSFEVKVTKNANTGIELENKSIVKFGEATIESEAIKNKVTEGNLSVITKRAIDLAAKTYKGGYMDYFVTVENISEKTQNDVKVDINLPEELELLKVFLITDNGKEEVETSKSVKIDEINAGETSSIYIITKINSLKNEDSKEIGISATAKTKDSKEAKSNTYIETVKDAKLRISLSANNENGYLKTDDIIEYTIKIDNISSVDCENVDITDTIPEQLSVQSVTIDGEQLENINNKLMFAKSIPANSTVEANVKAIVNYDETRLEPITISNVATLSSASEVIAKSEEVTHILQADSERADNNGNINTNNNLISGTAWLDENKDGQRDSNEKLLDGINVKLINSEGNTVKDSNGNEITATTNNNGLYILSNIPQGEYYVVFEYDTSLYVVTAYQKEGVSNAKNSDAISKQIAVNGQEHVYGVTDTIAINDNVVSNIDIGLMTSTKFDLELNKYISKIVVQTSAETKTYTYDKATLAKAEIAAKQLKGANVIIEYQLELKNAGEVAGYVKNIVDYMPSNLKFSSELNTSWYQSGSNLYNTSLANTKLEPGETKTLSLTLIKTMTEENTGLVNNTAEIGESYNEYGIADIDSTAGNKVKGEDDMGSADVIIGVKTGAMITYISWIIAILAVIGIAGYFVNRSVDKKHQIEDII